MLSVPPLTWLGRLSYSLYLWHMPVITASHHGGYSNTITAGAIAASVLIAWLSYRYVEKPFRRKQASPGRMPVVVLQGGPA